MQNISEWTLTVECLMFFYDELCRRFQYQYCAKVLEFISMSVCESFSKQQTNTVFFSCVHRSNILWRIIVINTQMDKLKSVNTDKIIFPSFFTFLYGLKPDLPRDQWVKFQSTVWELCIQIPLTLVAFVNIRTGMLVWIFQHCIHLHFHKSLFLLSMRLLTSMYLFENLKFLKHKKVL